MSIDVSPDVFTSDYVGEPGKRTFYLQARGESGTITLFLEKQQVSLLAEKLAELLLMIDKDDPVRATQAARDPALAIEEPLDPRWRAGAMGLAYEDDIDKVIVLIEPAQAEEENADEELEGIRFLLRRDQVRSFVLHAVAVVDEGRPLCMLCGLPIDLTGHACPASNGHRLGR